jgi:hypothetical protein
MSVLSTQTIKKLVENFELAVKSMFKFTAEEFYSESSIADHEYADL